MRERLKIEGIALGVAVLVGLDIWIFSISANRWWVLVLGIAGAAAFLWVLWRYLLNLTSQMASLVLANWFIMRYGGPLIFGRGHDGLLFPVIMIVLCLVVIFAFVTGISVKNEKDSESMK
ncbi:hypothetical protein PUF88_06060 [Lactobacillaceae bacterium L1_55_11]|nr:hypothetical protein [Lactobacillaceae bacterium L1_55_11]